MPIDFPAEYVLKTIEDWSVVYFKSKDHDPGAPPHYFFSIPIKEGVRLILCCVTSQVKKHTERHQKHNPNALKSLVHINPEIMPCFTKECIVDCHSADIGTVQDWSNKVSGGIKVVERNVPAEVKKQIFHAILASERVKPRIGRILQETYTF